MGVTLVVGYAPDGRGGAVLHLAGMLARSAHDDLVLCAVVPSPFPGEPAQEDSEYRRLLDGMARDALERARERLPGDVSASSVVDHARSAPAGLLDVAGRCGAAMIVVGANRCASFGVTWDPTTNASAHGSVQSPASNGDRPSTNWRYCGTNRNPPKTSRMPTP